MENQSSSYHPLRTLSLSLGALGIVYGDIGTSPLYAIKVSLSYIPVSSLNIEGILSLIFWALILVICIKYLVFILKADNHGEGGTMALLALFKTIPLSYKAFSLLLLAGFFATGLLFSDAMITPAISVISALEGLKVVSSETQKFIIPGSFIILSLLFSLQSRGTGLIGRLFSPIMLLWFLIIGFIGVLSILKDPEILKAINPEYAFLLFEHYHFYTLLILTGVFLVITGGEALYADISHFNKKTIRISWFCVVLPALLANYFGQGANLLIHPQDILNPFYLLAPNWFLYPLIFIATIATIIASQAVISAMFSLAKQAISLQYLPRMRVVYTSADIKGQVYVPAINLLMAIGTLSLVIIFQSSTNLALAYGIAVNLEMIIVTCFVFYLFYKQWHWPVISTLFFSLFFLSIDFTFFIANSSKILINGWLPIALALFATFIMISWQKGLGLLNAASTEKSITLTEIAETVKNENVTKIPGVAVFVDEPYDLSKSCLFNQIQSIRVIHETTILLDIEVEDKPRIDINHRVEILKNINGLYHIKFHYGFKQPLDIPATLEICKEFKILPFLNNERKFTYFLELVNAQINEEYNTDVPNWQKRLFIKLLETFNQRLSFYHLPLNQTILIGSYYEI